MTYCRDVSRKGTAVLRGVSAVMAVLVLTLGPPAVGPRQLAVPHHTKTSHTIRTIQIAESRIDYAFSPEVRDIWPIHHDLAQKSRCHSLAPDLPQCGGAFPQPALRAPPRY